jgi:nitrite reductase/ring-hydroxylating ferredoxin subunit
MVEGMAPKVMEGLPCSWYPLCRSGDVRRGQVLAADLAGQRLAVYRAASGAVSVLPARCPHAGADLARGMVVGERLRCPLHHRCFTADEAGWTGFPVDERWGLVFVWVGAGAPEPLPAPDAADTGLATAVTVCSVDAAAELVAANAFDAAHLGPVHGRAASSPPVVSEISPLRLRIAIQARVDGPSLRDRALRALGLDEVRIDTDCWAGNLLFFHHRRMGACTLLALRPDGALRTTVYALSLASRPAGRLRRMRARLRLAIQHRLILAFARQDLRALAGMRPGPMALDPVADACFLAFLDHYRRLPVSTWSR